MQPTTQQLDRLNARLHRLLRTDAATGTPVAILHRRRLPIRFSVDHGLVQSLLGHIQSNPDDDFFHEVLADHLDEEGKPNHADIIRRAVRIPNRGARHRMHASTWLTRHPAHGHFQVESFPAADGTRVSVGISTRLPNDQEGGINADAVKNPIHWWYAKYPAEETTEVIRGLLAEGALAHFSIADLQPTTTREPDQEVIPPSLLRSSRCSGISERDGQSFRPAGVRRCFSAVESDKPNSPIPPRRHRLNRKWRYDHEEPPADIPVIVTAAPKQEPTRFGRDDEPRHNDDARGDAEDYIATHQKRFGLSGYAPSVRRELDESLSRRTADAFDAMPHSPDDPRVRAAYQQLILETIAQYEHMISRGHVRPDPWFKSGQPYRNSNDMFADLKNNHHMWFFPTIHPTEEKTFGSVGGDLDPAVNPLVVRTGHRINGYDLTANDLLRVVHDYYAHAKEGNEFGPLGEYNAWAEHAKMYSPLALQALTTETHGQNSWVNFGPHLRREDGSLPRKGDDDWIDPRDRPFAEQKTNILPPDAVPPSDHHAERLARRSGRGKVNGQVAYRRSPTRFNLDPTVARKAVVSGSMHPLVLADWLEEERGLPGLAQAIRMHHSDEAIEHGAIERPVDVYSDMDRHETVATFNGKHPVGRGYVAVRRDRITGDPSFRVLMYSGDGGAEDKYLPLAFFNTKSPGIARQFVDDLTTSPELGSEQSRQRVLDAIAKSEARPHPSAGASDGRGTAMKRSVDGLMRRFARLAGGPVRMAYEPAPARAKPEDFAIQVVAKVNNPRLGGPDLLKLVTYLPKRNFPGQSWRWRNVTNTAEGPNLSMQEAVRLGYGKTRLVKPHALVHPDLVEQLEGRAPIAPVHLAFGDHDGNAKRFIPKRLLNKNTYRSEGITDVSSSAGRTIGLDDYRRHDEELERRRQEEIRRQEEELRRQAVAEQERRRQERIASAQAHWAAVNPTIDENRVNIDRHMECHNSWDLWDGDDGPYEQLIYISHGDYQPKKIDLNHHKASDHSFVATTGEHEQVWVLPLEGGHYATAWPGDHKSWEGDDGQWVNKRLATPEEHQQIVNLWNNRDPHTSVTYEPDTIPVHRWQSHNQSGMTAHGPWTTSYSDALTGGNNYAVNNHMGPPEDENSEEAHKLRVKQEPLIHPYSYSPDLIFHGGDRHRHYGAELETVLSDGTSKDLHNAAKQTLEVLNQGLGDEEFAYLKADQSLYKEGIGSFEIVTHPATMDVQEERWTPFLDDPPENLVSHDTDVCGLHIHVERKNLTPACQDRIFRFVNSLANKKFIEAIARRSSDRYAELKPNERRAADIRKGEKNKDRYEAVNFQNDDTLEFRIFKGTLNKDTFLRSLEFVDALTTFCSINRLHKVIRNGPLAFFHFVDVNEAQYPRLAKFIEKFRGDEFSKEKSMASAQLRRAGMVQR